MNKIPNNIKVFTKFLKPPKDGSVYVASSKNSKIYPNPEFFPSNMPNINDEFTGFDANIVILCPESIKSEMENRARRAIGIIKKHLLKPNLFNMKDFTYIVLSTEYFILK